MKFIFSALALAMCFCTFAQTPPGIDKPLQANAMLPECIDSDFSTSCNHQKLGEIISSMITDDMISDLPKSNLKSFSISCLFVTDNEGKVIPEYTEVRSDSRKLEKEAVLFINSSLPKLTPKDIKFTERRSVHIVNQTFLRNPKTKGYYVAYEHEIRNNKIKPNNITYDSAPIFPGCDKTADLNEQIECTKKKIFDFINDNYRIPGKEPLFVSMSIQLIVASDGKVSVDFIGGSPPDEYEYEVYRLVNRLPNLTPAYIKGIPAVISFPIPYLSFR